MRLYKMARIALRANLPALARRVATLDSLLKFLETVKRNPVDIRYDIQEIDDNEWVVFFGEDSHAELADYYNYAPIPGETFDTYDDAASWYQEFYQAIDTHIANVASGDPDTPSTISMKTLKKKFLGRKYRNKVKITSIEYTDDNGIHVLWNTINNLDIATKGDAKMFATDLEALTGIPWEISRKSTKGREHYERWYAFWPKDDRVEIV